MLFGKFPEFKSREEAEGKLACFHCGSIVGDRSTYIAPRDTGYPPGRGQYGAMCRECGFTTYYDISPNS